MTLSFNSNVKKLKIQFSFLTIVIILISCNQEKRHLDLIQDKAVNFIKEHSTEFLSNNELLIYSYHPRAQFTYTKDSTNRYRVFPRKNDIRLICFSDSCELTEVFKERPFKLSRGRYTLKQDSIFRKLNYDSSEVEFHPFRLDPENYYNGLKSKLKEYGVFALSQSGDNSFIKVYFSKEYYLIHSKDPQKDINNDKLIKSYIHNWHFIKMERPMDLG